jgi:hypothetical protein
MGQALLHQRLDYHLQYGKLLDSVINLSFPGRYQVLPRTWRELGGAVWTKMEIDMVRVGHP